jgi:hypothetical protein
VVSYFSFSIACPLRANYGRICAVDNSLVSLPREVLHFDEVASAPATRNFPELRDRKYDLVLTRGMSLPAKEQSADGLNVETLFDDPW